MNKIPSGVLADRLGNTLQISCHFVRLMDPSKLLKLFQDNSNNSPLGDTFKEFSFLVVQLYLQINIRILMKEKNKADICGTSICQRQFLSKSCVSHRTCLF